MESSAMTRPTQLISGDGPDYFTPPRPATNTTEVVLADTTFAHDANGNLTADASFFYQYDKADRLTNVIARATGARVFSATYDPLGRRREVVRADGTIDRYIYLPNSFLVLAVLDENNAVKELYTRGPDLGGDLDTAGGICGFLACTEASGTTRYLHPDAMGNIILATSDDGSVAGTYHYTPFGRPITQSSPYRPRFLFSSKEFDPETSLSYYGFRYYSPSLARWLTRDPIGEVDNILLYAFVINSPLRHCDSFGLETSFQTSQDDECCCTVTIIIELPNEDDEAKIERKGMAGHSGIAVDSEYYDYGPQPGEGASLMGSQGRPWWDRMSRLTSTEDAKLKDIEANIGKLAPGHEVYEVTIVAKSNECSVISQYWKDLYENPGTYKFFRKQCTTTVCLSLIQSGVANIKAYKPATLLNELRRKAKHTCEKRGQAIRKRHII